MSLIEPPCEKMDEIRAVPVALVWNLFGLQKLNFFSTGHMLLGLRELQVSGSGFRVSCLLDI